MAMRAALLLALVAVLAFYAAPAEAGFYQGFYDLAAFQAYDFMVDSYVNFIAYADYENLGAGVGYFTLSPYTQFGSFPLYGLYATDYVSGSGPYAGFGVFAVEFLNDYLVVPPYYYIGLHSPFFTVNALGFFLSDSVDHNSLPGGEYINRFVLRNNFFYSYTYDNFRGVNDVFIGFIDSTGFEGVWAGWYDATVNVEKDVDSALAEGNFNGFYHLLTPAAYVGAGGDPHIVARAARSEMAGVMAGDIVNLVDHPKVSVNAAIREFDFLPESMRENNYFGTVAVQLANGDRVLVVAAENEEGAPAYSVTLNGAEVALGSRIDTGDALVHLDSYEALDKAHGQSWFQEQFPSQTHEAVARVWVRDHIVVDVSLSSKETFVDWHRGDPQVYRTPGAFLNVNMRDLVQDAPTRGLLRAVDDVHQRKNMRERALEKGMQLEERDIDVDFDGLVSAIVDQHRVASLF